MSKTEFEKLKKENEEIREGVNAIFRDLKLDETAKDLWELINKLINNEIEQEGFCNQ